MLKRAPAKPQALSCVWWGLRTHFWALLSPPTAVTDPCSVVLRVDGFNPAVAGAGGGQVPPQMMGMGMSARGGAMGPDGAGNLGAAMMPENGAMVTYAQKGCCALVSFSRWRCFFSGSFIRQTAYIFLTQISSDEVFEGHHFNLGSRVLRIQK